MFDRLFKRRSTGLDVSSATDKGYAIHASLQELIGLRMYARQLSFASTVPSSNLMVGNHLSRFKGRGMDYLESRNYQPGDDIRNMDWRVTARTGQPHIKLFQEERQRPVLIMLDLNPGMFFASQGRFKSVIAAQAAAILAWAAASHGDRVGGLILNREHVEQPPQGNKNGILSFLHQLAEHSNPEIYIRSSSAQSPDQQQQPATDFENGLKRLARIARPGSLVFILSDFYQLNEQSIQQLAQLQANCECVLVRILDALETTPPPANRYSVTNGRQQSVLNTADTRQAEQYRLWFSQHQAELDKVSRQLAIPRIELNTSEHPIQRLRKVFSNKSASRKPVSLRANRR